MVRLGYKLWRENCLLISNKVCEMTKRKNRKEKKSYFKWRISIKQGGMIHVGFGFWDFILFFCFCFKWISFAEGHLRVIVKGEVAMAIQPQLEYLHDL